MAAENNILDLTEETPQEGVFKFEPIKGYPMLNWKGKRPFTSTRYYPAQLKEQHGESVNGWLNKIFWGDNLQVMSHLLREFRGKVDLIYIDPPFDSKADYKKKIIVKKSSVSSDQTNFEEKQYQDIWANDDYLQFMYERLIMLRELLSETGSIFLHCDWHKEHHLRLILDEIFGQENFINAIVWRRKGGSALGTMTRLSSSTDRVLWYSKTSNYTINQVFVEASVEYINQQFKYTDANNRKYMITVLRSPSLRPNLMYDYKGYKMPPNGWAVPKATMEKWDEEGRLHFPDSKEKQIYKKIFLDEYKGQALNDLWSDISTLKGSNSEITGYPTQKPEELLERILNLASKENSVIFDCFMGSGTTQAVAMKLGRRFIGADINLGAIQTTTKRLIKVADDLKNTQPELGDDQALYTGFEVYNVNHYDVFRNPVQAKELLIQALDIQSIPNSVYDGEKDGRMVKLMPVNHIATRQDVSELIHGVDYKAFEKRKEAKPNQPVEKITIFCMGHEPDLAAFVEQSIGYKLDIEVVDILRDRSDLQFKRDSEALFKVEESNLVVDKFYPMSLLQKISQTKDSVSDWREMVESIMIDWNYDGAVFQPTLTDIPAKNDLVLGQYKIPEDAGTIRIKIIDLLSESLERDLTEEELANG